MIENSKKEEKKHAMLAKTRLSSIETLISQQLVDFDISHEECRTIVNEKEKYEQIRTC